MSRLSLRLFRLHPKKADGFVLLEALLAMSLILGAWITSVNAYQSLALRLAQQERTRTQLQDKFDAFEMAEQVRANAALTNQIVKGSTNESSRVPSRNRAVRITSQSTTQNQRRSDR